MCLHFRPRDSAKCIQITYLNSVVMPDDDDASSSGSDSEDEAEGNE